MLVAEEEDDGVEVKASIDVNTGFDCDGDDAGEAHVVSELEEDEFFFDGYPVEEEVAEE